MGIHDEYVLDLVHQKINSTTAPFFAVHYNVSTHYPYDLPKEFGKDLPQSYTAPMKSMSYYDHSLQKFFAACRIEPWFNNTIFIFCSDHWLVPDDTKTDYNAVSGYHIPIIIYDPSRNEKIVNATMASQFDVMGTVLSISGYRDSIISYGGTLLNKGNNEVVVSRPNSSLYQATDSSYVLGFNSNNDKVEFLYNYRSDRSLQHNLLNDKNEEAAQSRLLQQIKAFLQKASMQYNHLPFK
jgi:phosphoglycerol transferase MdoB-like AlkP superfamily enzyme